MAGTISTGAPSARDTEPAPGGQAAPQPRPAGPAPSAVNRGDPGDTPATAAPLALDTPVLGSIVVRRNPDHPSIDEDWYAFDFVAGETYDITLSAVRIAGVRLSDPYLTLVDARGNVVAENDDAVGLDAALTIGFAEDATYYVVPGSYYANDSGGYRLKVTQADAADPLEAIDWGVRVAGTTVAVYFARGGESFDGSRNDADWTPYERAQVFEALGTYEDVSNLSFVEVASAGTADFILTKNPGGDALGWFNPPDPSLGWQEGVGWFNDGADLWSDAAGGLLAAGSNTFLTFLHEFGHGLGLAHPHDDGGGSTIMAGATGGPSLDQGVFTVMSYNDGWWDGPSGPSPDQRYGFNLTPAALDIALIQKKYGADTTHNAGNDTYTLPMTNAPGTGYATIWDTGGVDTIAAAGTRATVIDLTAATITGSAATGGGVVSYAAGIYGGFTIAGGVAIENASGGSGADAIGGNGLANLLSGNAGGDTLAGGAGNDTLDGGPGADTMEGGSGNDVYVVDQRGDRIVEAAGEGVDLVRSATVDIDLGAYRNVEVAALTGTAGLDVTGDARANFILGNAGRNALSGGEGDDRIRGGRGADVVRGEGGNDVLLGQDGNDVLFGNAGRDNLRGGTGTDLLIGGRGADRFVVGPDQGNDTIRDFEPGVDKIHLAALSLGTYAALTGAMVQTGRGVHITFGREDGLTVEGATLADLSADDFIL
ncbi:M10 family metallopeptidase [Acuticoccus sp. I52.16.1]|uniref:M10 family metallopeptidase n=1 Tax=Acuticoccus sp. I52.16.1 TaxID=2928472 RepID=UPI001FD06DD0|nr:M10 family metallopeptidase C-terminal domain-containing protein [Acuticoccus sp. I52.16.1]UOM36248.1 M10 family metallopeptidase C-terminal domain-containing protein [Acuticoccus sp. I52.16.1]